MSKNSEEILKLINSFEIRRAREIDETVLKSMTAREDGKKILDHFTKKENLIEDENGYLASFVVLSSNNTPLIFFSLRCGELFEKINYTEKEICIAQQVFDAMNNKDTERVTEIMKNAKKQGLSFSDILAIRQIKKIKKHDNKMFENIENTNKVIISYPAVELKLFGTNESAKKYWKDLNLPKEIKMGETLFWLKIVKTIEEMTKYVGCQYMYLFAADKEANGKLVQYYRTRLGFGTTTDLSVNKPSFDWSCQFLSQKINDLFDNRNTFIRQIQKIK